MVLAAVVTVVFVDGRRSFPVGPRSPLAERRSKAAAAAAGAGAGNTSAAESALVCGLWAPISELSPVSLGRCSSVLSAEPSVTKDGLLSGA